MYFFNSKPLFILDIANNHMGSVKHAIDIIKSMVPLKETFPEFEIAIKLQYRDLDTFIHPDFTNDETNKHIKRFLSTRLTYDQLKEIKEAIVEYGFIAICTPFDETSVDKIVEHGFDIIKVASCSFTDWPLLEKIAQTAKPLILSVAGASLIDIDKVVSFLQHRDKRFCLMHCVAEYPTKLSNLNLNQIDVLRERYSVPIGFSTHEILYQDLPIQIAVAKSVRIFERHIGLTNKDFPELNKYSSTFSDIEGWMDAAAYAIEICGSKLRKSSPEEIASLTSLTRGAYAARDIPINETVTVGDVFFAIPRAESQLDASCFSKYLKHRSTKPILKNERLRDNTALFFGNISTTNIKETIRGYFREVQKVIKQSGVFLPDKLDIELSHHYGLSCFSSTGAAIINVLNREYCKKVIVVLPHQSHPTHYHLKKEETFLVLYGNITFFLNGEQRKCTAGHIVIVERGVKHAFVSQTGAVFEEISTTHFKDDSYYEDEKIMTCNNRKTKLTAVSGEII